MKYTNVDTWNVGRINHLRDQVRYGGGLSRPDAEAVLDALEKRELARVHAIALMRSAAEFCEGCMLEGCALNAEAWDVLRDLSS